jgi:hypothetical protein
LAEGPRIENILFLSLYDAILLLSFKTFYHIIYRHIGRAVAQAASRQPFTAAARVRVQVRPCGMCGERNGIGKVSLRVLRFYSAAVIQTYAYAYAIWGMNNRSVGGRNSDVDSVHRHE